ncbi:Protein-tyrosine-phosphatase [Enhydrobacter aerosaccus]|uniref:Protein-tyrosine-phosphatase n=1 Tax=Enhydrobacter aerosaccus TaxID=225324 RepID=A0A1T4MMA4_9HYPH|nr:arsenate reductase ArsC [Enhydrobacter aerosaccus]SJZ67904.1 Protein-tyrosine-phosphatase [Enhydrobacter aerosaccus]
MVRSGLPGSLLFACTHNSIRSPMAEALARRLYGNAAYIDSVGVHATELDSFAAAVLDEVGIDYRHHHAKTFDDVEPSSFEVIVSLSPEAHHSALEFTRSSATDVEYWPVPDPSAVEGSRETRLDAYRRVRDVLLDHLKTRFGTPRGPSL